MRIIGLHGGSERAPGACEFYRVNIPLYYLSGKRGWQTEWMYMRTLFAQVLAQGPQSIDTFFRDVDMIVLPRITLSSEMPAHVLDDFFDVLRHYGIKTVYEVDDDFTNLYRQVVDTDMQSIASRCDAVTVTTPYLAELMQQFVGRPTYVLPNMLDPRLWHDGDMQTYLRTDIVDIWLSGSKTHQGDWVVLKDIFPPLLKKHPHARLVIGGYHPDYLSGIEGAVYLDGMRYDRYAQTVRQVDIVLAPVDPADGFNAGKSPVKATEGQGAVRKIENRFCGAAVVATDNPVYRLTVKPDYDGMLVPFEPQAWYDALDTLLTDTAQRHRLQANAYRSVWHRGTWDISKQWTQWAKVYQRVKDMPTRKVHNVASVGEGVMS